MDAMADFLRQHLKPGQTAFDVGANRGDYALLMADIVGPTGRVEAFEPNPELAATLTGPPHLHVHNLALSDEHGDDLTFYVDARDQALASSFHRLQGLEGQTREIRVAASTVDEHCATTGAVPDLVKIDTEGHEAHVIRGAVRTIAKHRPVVVFEFWQTWWDLGIREVFDYLRDGYQLVRIQDGQDVTGHYYQHREEGTVDIGAIPRRRLFGAARLNPARLGH